MKKIPIKAQSQSLKNEDRRKMRELCGPVCRGCPGEFCARCGVYSEKTRRFNHLLKTCKFPN